MSEPRFFTFGCSFTWGLVRKPEDYVGITGINNRCKTWGDFLSERFDMEHRNHGASGSGNKQIAWSVRNSNIQPGDFAIVAWSGPMRPFKWVSGEGHTGPTQGYTTLLADDQPMDWQQLYYENEVSIRSTANYLRGKSVTFLMTSALMDYKQFEFLSDDFTRHDWLSWNWIEWDMYNNSLFDICSHTWLTSKCQRFNFSDKSCEQHHYLKYNPDLTEDNDLLAECLHPSQAGHESIANTLMPYVENAM